MPCYYPIDGWRSRHSNDNGKYPIVFNQANGDLDHPVTVKCGRCIGCRLEYSRQWAMRCVHEGQLHDNNCFITLTYDDDHLPHMGSLDKTHLQKFFKRFRKKFPKSKGHTIRYFAAGEYGDQTDRPHYHALIFGFDFPDINHKIKKHKIRDGEHPLYTHPYLEELWPSGHSSIGALTFESAAYTARYCLKKINGEGDADQGIPSAEEHYSRFDSYTGEYTQIQPEFVTMSRRPGIAHNWFKKYRNDLDKGFVTIRGKEMPPPKYYDTLFEKYVEQQDGLFGQEEEYLLNRYKDNKLNRTNFETDRSRLPTKEAVVKANQKRIERQL